MRVSYLLFILVILLNSCKDEGLDKVMDRYCKCIDDNQESIDGRYECIQIMDSLQKVYVNNYRKLNLIIEKAGECP